MAPRNRVRQQLNKFRGHMDKLSDAGMEAARVAVRETSETALSLARLRVPRVTGKLASSIVLEYGKTGLTAKLRAGTYEYPIAHLVEFGHKARDGSHVAARPFLTPAAEAVRPILAERLAALIKEAVK